MSFLINLTVLLLISIQALAEYRVFTLHILNKTTLITRQIETTQDPEQFIGLYPLKTNEKISYIETWRCQGRTDFFKPHCNNPRLLDQEPVVVTSQSPEILK